MRLGPATLVIYDVTTLYFETGIGDGFREPGFSKERRFEPQITVGLLTDVRGFPLMVHAFDGNKAETKTILPVVQAFAAPHQVPEVTVVADAGMLSEADLAAIEDAGVRFIVAARIPDIPYQVAEWRRTDPGEPIGDGQIFTQPWVMGTKADPRRWTIYYQYRADRARRTLTGIDQQITKAQKTVAGQAAIKRNRFVQLTGGTKASTVILRPRPVPWRPEGLHHQSVGDLADQVQPCRGGVDVERQLVIYHRWAQVPGGVEAVVVVLNFSDTQQVWMFPSRYRAAGPTDLPGLPAGPTGQ